jgi:hypothetical protein
MSNNPGSLAAIDHPNPIAVILFSYTSSGIQSRKAAPVTKMRQIQFNEKYQTCLLSMIEQVILTFF